MEKIGGGELQRVEKEKTTISGKESDRAVDVSVHSLLVEPRRHSELLQAVVNALHLI